ncbi:MAG: radical SAM/SPASM domain-containing protein [Romboutsia sp.]
MIGTCIYSNVIKLTNNSDLVIIERNNLVLMYNKKIKKHIFQSKEVYGYIKKASEEGMVVEEFINLFSGEDKVYIKNLIEHLISAGIIFIPELNQAIKKEIDIKSIHLVTTKKCNLECMHCCSSCSPKEKTILSIDELKKIVDFCMTLNPSEIVISGGEPLIRKDFFELVKYITNNYKVRLILSTNLTLMNEDNIDFIINNFNRIDVSLDGVDSESCDRIRGKGVFDKIIQGIKKLQEKGFYNIRTSMIFYDKNLHLEGKYEDLNKMLGTQPLKRRFEAVGRGKDNVLEFLHNDDITIGDSACKLMDYSNRSECTSCKCEMYMDEILIDHDGRIYPCPELTEDKFSLGNILEDETKNRLLNYHNFDSEVKSNLESIYPYNNNRCKNCDVGVFCMTCPGMLNLVSKNEKDFNKWCGLRKEKLEKLIWEGNY